MGGRKDNRGIFFREPQDDNIQKAADDCAKKSRNKEEISFCLHKMSWVESFYDAIKRSFQVYRNYVTKYQEKATVIRAKNF